jgi:chromosome partitioning protein
MARVIAVANPRTGSGKTTTVASLGAMLVDLGMSVLVVDLDPQASLTTRLGVDAERIASSLYDVIMLGERAVDAMVDTDARVDLLPAALELSGVEAALVTRSGREQLVKDALREVRDDYDFILVDCASSLGILTQNGLSMADLLLIPMTEYSQRATAQLLESVDEISKFVNPSLEVLGVLPTNVDTVSARQIVESVQQEHGLPVLPHIPSGSRALNAYREFAKTLITR